MLTVNGREVAQKHRTTRQLFSGEKYRGSMRKKKCWWVEAEKNKRRGLLLVARGEEQGLMKKSDPSPEKAHCKDVFLKRLFCTRAGTASLLSSTTTLMPSLSDSSLKSEIPSSFLSFTRSAIFSNRAADVSCEDKLWIKMALVFENNEKNEEMEAQGHGIYVRRMHHQTD